MPFKILERDNSHEHRGQGWAITIHWALQYLKQMVPATVLAGIETCQVDPDVARNDTGSFLFLNLEDGSVKFRIPPSKRWRINRENMRLALLEGIAEHIYFGKQVDGIESATGTKEHARIKCSDGSFFEADVVIGTDGSNSQVRRVLCPDTHKTTQLPFRFVGVQVRLTKEQIAPLRSIDPLLFQGCHPRTRTFLWFSILETPSDDESTYNVQINLSWPYKTVEDEVEVTNAARLRNMKARVQDFTPVLRTTIQEIPECTPVLEIKLADWDCVQWDNRGFLTLSGDAAHPMTMCKQSSSIFKPRC